MKTLIICIPPELSSAGAVKKFLRWLSEEIRGFWEPRCPGCDSKRVWRDGVEPRKTAPPVQRYECPQGKKFCGRTGTPFYRKHAPSARIFSAFTLFLVGLSFRAASRALEVSHVTVAGMVHGAGTQEDPHGRRPEVGRRRDLRQGRGENDVRVQGGGLEGQASLEGSLPRRRETEAQGWFSPGRPRGCGKPEVFMHDGNRVYHRALRNLDLDWREGVVVHRREWGAEDGSTTNLLEGHWSHFRCWCGVHRGFKRWANAQHYHEQYVRARNHPEKNTDPTTNLR